MRTPQSQVMVRWAKTDSKGLQKQKDVLNTGADPHQIETEVNLVNQQSRGETEPLTTGDLSFTRWRIVDGQCRCLARADEWIFDRILW
jgi:hypothetical protein